MPKLYFLAPSTLYSTPAVPLSSVTIRTSYAYLYLLFGNKLTSVSVSIPAVNVFI
nr:MAG TPA: hypothetical protein [Crassvirales sp.]